MKHTGSDGAFAICAAIARDRAAATGTSDFADGFRAAANDIARAIEAKREGRPPTTLERDLRECVIEARALARVVTAAETLIAAFGPDSDVARGARELVLCFFDEDELPLALRRPRTLESGTSLMTQTVRELPGDP